MIKTIAECSVCKGSAQVWEGCDLPAVTYDESTWWTLQDHDFNGRKMDRIVHICSPKCLKRFASELFNKEARRISERRKKFKKG